MTDLFWLTALVPGFALLRLCFPEDLRRGLLPAFALPPSTDFTSTEFDTRWLPRGLEEKRYLHSDGTR